MPCDCSGYEGNIDDKPIYIKSWFIENLCKLCRKMSFSEIKDNDLLDWYKEHLISDFHFNRDKGEKQSALNELKRIGENVSI